MIKNEQRYKWFALLGFWFCSCLAQMPLSAQDLNFDWTRHYDGRTGSVPNLGTIRGFHNSRGTAITTDREGNVYTAGVFMDTVNFGTSGTPKIYRSVRAGGLDIFVTKSDPKGNLLWAQQIKRDTFDLYVSSITVDAADNLYLTGEFVGKVDFNPGTAPRDTFYMNSKRGGKYCSEIFVMKLNAEGNFIWAKQLVGSETSRSYGYAIVSDKRGSLYLTGSYTGTVDFDPGPSLQRLKSNVNEEAFLLKLNEEGNFTWAKRMGGAMGDIGCAVTLDDSGNNIYLTGIFNGRADFDSTSSGGAALTALGSADIFAARLNSNGDLIWVKRMGGVDYECPNAIAVDAKGNTYITGYFNYGAAYFDPESWTNGALIGTASVNNYFITSLDNQGKFRWAKGIYAVGNNNEGRGLSLDAAGNPYVMGWFHGSTSGIYANMDPGFSDYTISASIPNIQPPTITASMFIIKYSDTGKLDWVKHYWGDGTTHLTSYTIGNSMCTDRFGSVLVTGGFAGEIDFDPGPGSELEYGRGTTITPLRSDIFVHKLSCADTASLSLTETSCGPYVLDNTVYTESGIYTRRVPNGKGCYDNVTLNLTVMDMIEPLISVERDELKVPDVYSHYQWLKEGVEIPGANAYRYKVQKNGLYAVVVTNRNGCIDTSESYKVSNSGPGSSLSGEPLEVAYRVYPNPVATTLYLDIEQEIKAYIYGVDGRMILPFTKSKAIDVSVLPAGLYFLRITNRDNQLLHSVKFTKL